MAGVVRHLFIAPRKGLPMAARAYVEAVEGAGLEGDRYAEPVSRGEAGRREVTLIEMERVEDFNREFGLALKPAGPRRNIVTSGVRLNDLVGRRFSVGEATLEGMELCEPCRKFARPTYPQVLRAFRGKGGLRARIVAGGGIRVGDAIVAVP